MTTPLEQATCQWLRSRAENLDGRMRSRLNRARQAALDELEPKGRWVRTPFLPLGAALGAALVALFVVLPYGNQHPLPAPAVAAAAASIDDSELVGTGGEGLLDEDPTLFALAAVDEAAP